VTAFAQGLVSRIDEQPAAAKVGLAAGITYLGVTAWAMRYLPYDRWMLFFLLPVLIASGLAIIAAVSRRDDVPLTGLVSTAFLVKLAMTLMRYYVIVGVYGTGDALRYDQRGMEIADSYRAGELTLLQLLPSETGTPAVEQLTGLLYALIGPSILGGFFVFSWLAFFGLFLFHRAARIGFPEADQRRYALLVLFLPSLLFWPSSIGKESLVMLGLGAASYGAARLLERHAGGWVSFVLGTSLVFLVRPHVAAVLLGALGVAFLFRRGRMSVIGPVVRLSLVGLIMVATSWVLGQAVARFLPNAADNSLDAVDQLLNKAAYGTAEGGSTIESVVPNSLLDYPFALVNVLIRPFLFEAGNVTQLVAALETTLLLTLAVLSWRRLRNLPIMVFRRPYLLFSIVYIGVFSFAWSAFMNLGALARQRVQVWPFLLLLLVVPEVVEKAREAKRTYAVRPMLRSAQTVPASARTVPASGRREMTPGSPQGETQRPTELVDHEGGHSWT